MSASERAFWLPPGGVNLPALQPAAANPDLVSYHDVLRKLAEQGWQIVPFDRNVGWVDWRQVRTGDPVPALLRTKCGCERQIVVRHPLQQVYRLAIPDAPRGCSASALSAPHVTTREYWLRVEADSDYRRRFVYVEA